jgi:hypothetical protein
MFEPLNRSPLPEAVYRMDQKFLAAALALLVPLFGVARLGESCMGEENGKQSIGSADSCPLLPSIMRSVGAGELWRVATGASKFQFVDPRVIGLGRRSLALSSFLAHSWPMPLVLSPQLLRVKLQV